jgi:energy-coupling factor transport system permease protein
VIAGALLFSVIRDGTGRSALLAGYEQGARPGLVLLCIGAAISLSQPARLLIRLPRPIRIRPVTTLAQLLPAYGQLRSVHELRPDIPRRSLLAAIVRTAGERARQQQAALAERGYRRGDGAVDRWHAGEWFALLAGAGIACCYCLCAVLGSALTPDPWTWEAPTIPGVAAIGLVLAVLPAHLTPAPPRPVAPHARPLAAA